MSEERERGFFGSFFKRKMRFRKSENLIAHNIICDYTKLAKPIWTEKPARFRSRLSPVKYPRILGEVEF